MHHLLHICFWINGGMNFCPSASVLFTTSGLAQKSVFSKQGQRSLLCKLNAVHFPFTGGGEVLNRFQKRETQYSVKSLSSHLACSFVPCLYISDLKGFSTSPSFLNKRSDCYSMNWNIGNFTHIYVIPLIFYIGDHQNLYQSLIIKLCILGPSSIENQCFYSLTLIFVFLFNWSHAPRSLTP